MSSLTLRAGDVLPREQTMEPVVDPSGARRLRLEYGMRSLLRWVWMTLVLLASGSLSAHFLVVCAPAHLLARAAASPRASSTASPGFRLSEFRGAFRNPAAQAGSEGKIKNCKRLNPRDGDGPSPEARLHGPDALGVDGLAFAHVAFERGFYGSGFGIIAHQGMRPEQGGQTGPPEASENR